MSEENIFFGDIIETCNNLLKIGGVANRDIYVGDKIFVKETELCEDGAKNAYTIKVMETYGKKNVGFLCRGMTGYLFVNGREYGFQKHCLFYLYEACIDARRKVCLDILREKFADIPQPIEQLVLNCDNIKFFEKFMQFNYKIHTLNEFRTLIYESEKFTT